MGKENALRKGMSKARGNVLIIQDADLEYDPNDYGEIVKKFDDENVSVVYGSRILGSKVFHNYSSNALFYFGAISLTKVTNVSLGTNISDQPTCYKSWRKDLTKGLLEYCRTNGFEFDIEMTAFFSKQCKIVEVPIHYYPRTVKQGKKITLVSLFGEFWIVDIEGLRNIYFIILKSSLI